MSEVSNSGIIVLEGHSGGQPLPVRRETLVAFIGPTPRGPVSIPALVTSLDEYVHRFGVPGDRSGMQHQIAQYFENGGREAVIVRVCPAVRFKQIEVPGPFGSLLLEARNPGPLEHLRVAVDLDDIASDDLNRFNLVVHRLTSPDHPIVEEQEIFRGVSIDPDDADCISDVLLDSRLIRVVGDPPLERPYANDSDNPYVFSCGEWDDLATITDYDLVGSDTFGTGLFALDRIAQLDILCLVPGDTGIDVGPVALFAAERYCRKRNALLLADPRSDWNSAADAIQYCEAHGFSSPNVAMYFPMPARRDNESIADSILGAIAGKLASDDTRFGVWGRIGREQITLHSRSRVRAEPTATQCSALVRAGINVVQNVRPGYLRLEGLVTMAQRPGISTLWSHLPQQRAALFIVGSIVRGTRWAALQENNAQTRAVVVGQVKQFLDALFEQGAFEGAESGEASYVLCDADVNRNFSDHSGHISIVVGFSLRACDMTAFRITHHHATSTVREFGWHPDVALAG